MINDTMRRFRNLLVNCCVWRLPSPCHTFQDFDLMLLGGVCRLLRVIQTPSQATGQSSHKTWGLSPQAWPKYQERELEWQSLKSGCFLIVPFLARSRVAAKGEFERGSVGRGTFRKSWGLSPFRLGQSAKQELDWKSLKSGCFLIIPFLVRSRVAVKGRVWER